MDFFISYNHHDKPWAEWIAWVIEEAGYTSAIQAWDFRPGSNFVIEMHDSVDRADRLIIVLSENYLKSEYTYPEWAALFVNDPQGSKKKVLPVRVASCEIPGLLRCIVYIDLYGKDETEARTALLAGLCTDRAKPTNQPRFPLPRASQYPAAGIAAAGGATPPERIKFALVLTGTVDDMNKPLVEAMLEHLRRLTQDPNITFRKIRAGSVQIIFECSRLTLAKLRTLVACGELENIKGFHIEQLTDAPDVINKPRIPRPEEKSKGSFVDVLPEAYPTLIMCARQMLRRERMSDTREPEALVHDTVLEMRDIEQSTWTAEELFSVVARRMRHKLFDEYRALKRGSARTSPFDDALSLPSTSLLTPIERDKAIDQLAKASPDLAQLIELRYFEELTIPEIAKRLDKRNIWVSERTQEAIAQLRKILNR